MSRAFKFILSTREKFYEAGVLRTFRLDFPVISVGNLTLGGTGKTPFVIALAEKLREEGYRPVVLSRGYKRKSSGVLVVSRGHGPLRSWEESGDEPFLIARRLSGVAVVVGADRYEGGRKAQEENLGDIFVLDDGFQHRRLVRNVDIVMIDPAEWNAGEKFIPAGRWREPKEALKRAHAAVVGEGKQLGHSLPIPSFRMETVVDGLFSGTERVSPDTLAGRQVVAFAGIAKPERFFSAVEKLGIPLARRVRFRDHHAYRPEEIAELGGDIRVTTEKDAVRLEGFSLPRFLHLRISARIPEFGPLIELIRGRISS